MIGANPGFSMRIAVLLTCHNRRETTLDALRALFAQDLPPGVFLIAYLVDDGSADGTGEAVLRNFPRVRLLHGDGTLYWSRGMRWAYGEALAEGYDFYLWLNDDVMLHPDAIRTLLATSDALRTGGLARLIVVGSTGDPETGQTTYGGVVRSSRLHPLKFRLLEPAADPQPCATMNGNVVLISQSAAEAAGNISQVFSHGIGDFDYGLQAVKQGCSIWLAPGYAGSCRQNTVANTWRDPSLSVRKCLRLLTGIKGLPPGPYRRYARAHAGPLWPLFWLAPYVRAILYLAVRRIGGRTRTPRTAEP